MVLLGKNPGSRKLFMPSACFLQSKSSRLTLPLFICQLSHCLYRQYDLRENSKRSDVLIDLTEFCGQLVEAKCLAINPQDNNYLAVGANGPFVRLYDIRMIHNYRLVKFVM